MNIRLMKYLCQLSDKELKNILYNFLKKKYRNVECTDEYIIAEGTLPICLVAHLDTVFPTPVKEFYYDKKLQVLWSPQGLGADDRAGVYAILQILEDGYKPSVIFTMGEEKGGLGAKALAKRMPDCPFVGLKAIIELDRQGKDDCVFYECDNDDFTKYIESFGFNTEIGSYSDINFFAPIWGVAAVNLSVGYIDEHSYSERLIIKYLEDTIMKVEAILSQSIPMKTYAYVPYNPKIERCVICGRKATENQRYEIIDLNGLSFRACEDCHNSYYK